jgi:tetratricopeptide (TPR) repeat protein
MPDHSDPPPYKPTLFDRLGPDAGAVVRAWALGIWVFGLSVAAFAFQGHMSLLSYAISAAFGALAGGGGLWIANLTGRVWTEVFLSGSGTPAVEQYSYQQSLVMQGKVDEALESFEAIIAESPTNVDARIRAAELYAEGNRNPARAAELFREVRRVPGIPPGTDTYASNRLVDLLCGPLGDPGRALGELRRLIDRNPGTAVASNARAALARLKASQPAE